MVGISYQGSAIDDVDVRCFDIREIPADELAGRKLPLFCESYNKRNDSPEGLYCDRPTLTAVDVLNTPEPVAA
jgi:hypothetical protein